MQANQLAKQFGTIQSIHKPDLVSLLRQAYPDAKPTTLDWHIYDLVKQGLLTRQGRGRYRVVSADNRRVAFAPGIPDELGFLGKKLAEAFPLLTTCLWSTETVQPYLMHVPFVKYWLLEIDRDAVDTVLSFVQSVYSANDVPATIHIIRASDLATVAPYLTDTARIVLLKPLVSEAPLQRIGDVTTITAEKLLIDLIADDTLFFMYQEELPRIIQGITARYVINTDKLRRYARRRHQLPQLNRLLLDANAHLPA